MKKRTSIALSLVFTLLCTVVLGACSGSKDSTGIDETNKPAQQGDTVTPPENNEVVKLTVWTHVSEDSLDAEVYTQRIEEYNKKFSGKYNATIEFIPRNNSGGGYLDKINAALASNSLPDVVTCDGPDTSAWVQANILVPIDEYVTPEEKSDYVDSIIAQGTVDGKLYALAGAETSVGIYYNKELLSKNGITPATFDKPWTWTEFQAALQKLKESGVKYPFSMSPWDKSEWQPYVYMGFFWSNGGDAMDAAGNFEGVLNSDTNVKTGEFISNLCKQKLMPITTIDTPKEFREGTLAMFMSGPWELGNLRAEGSEPNFEWDIMPYPVSDSYSGGKYTPCGSWSFGVTSAAKDIAGAAEIVKIMTDKDGSKLFAEKTGNLPSHKSLVDMFANDPMMSNLVKQNVNTAHVRPVTPYYPIFREGFIKAMEGIFNGRDVKQSLDDGVKYINNNIRK